MNEIYENDAHRVPVYRPLPQEPEAITELQAVVKQYISQTNKNRELSGLAPLSKAQEIHCFERLCLPVPEHYQQNS